MMIRITVILVLVALATVAKTSVHNDRVFLGNVRSITFEDGDMTVGRRYTPEPRLQFKSMDCPAGDCPDFRNFPKVITCLNTKMGVTDPEWQCTAILDDGIDLGGITVVCEGYDHRDDPYVSLQSCLLEYTLVSHQQKTPPPPTVKNVARGKGVDLGSHSYASILAGTPNQIRDPEPAPKQCNPDPKPKTSDEPKRYTLPSFIGAGSSNTIRGPHDAIVAGSSNTIIGSHDAIVTGFGNDARAMSEYRSGSQSDYLNEYQKRLREMKDTFINMLAGFAVCGIIIAVIWCCISKWSYGRSAGAEPKVHYKDPEEEIQKRRRIKRQERAKQYPTAMITPDRSFIDPGRLFTVGQRNNIAGLTRPFHALFTGSSVDQSNATPAQDPKPQPSDNTNARLSKIVGSTTRRPDPAPESTPHPIPERPTSQTAPVAPLGRFINISKGENVKQRAIHVDENGNPLTATCTCAHCKTTREEQDGLYPMREQIKTEQQVHKSTSTGGTARR